MLCRCCPTFQALTAASRIQPAEARYATETIVINLFSRGVTAKGFVARAPAQRKARAQKATQKLDAAAL
jgi:hypothetical protein